MAQAQRVGWIGAGLLLILAYAFPIAEGDIPSLHQMLEGVAHLPDLIVGLIFTLLFQIFLGGLALFFLAIGAWPAGSAGRGVVVLPLLFLAVFGMTLVVHATPVSGNATIGTGLQMAGLWLAAWMSVEAIVAANVESSPTPLAELAPPFLFGLTLLLLWEWIVAGFGIPAINLLAPSAIGVALGRYADTLSQDFIWTFLHEALLGWLLGSGAGFLMALVADRIPFLRRGLLPLGNVVSALPIVGIAPIMIWWFSYDWPSKTAVVIAMTFFPMLVNTVAGLAASGSLEKDLMRSYGASYWSTLTRLRLPAAMPFIFNGLKINSTLAMIGAIVAEYLDGPTIGMGFRINTQAALSQTDIVWAEIAVAMVAGSIFYGIIALVERVVTFWHPSYRRV